MSSGLSATRFTPCTVEIGSFELEDRLLACIELGDWLLACFELEDWLLAGFEPEYWLLSGLVAFGLLDNRLLLEANDAPPNFDFWMAAMSLLTGPGVLPPLVMVFDFCLAYCT